VRAQNLPRISGRYWCAIVVASMAGANTGDFAARYLQLGHIRGLLPLTLIFLAIVWAETSARRATETYYWLAIIVLRTGATNLADLATHDLRLGYPLTLAALAAFIIAVLLFAYWRDGSAAPAAVDGRKLPATDGAYWLAMLTAGTLGTAGGDFAADELELGVGYGPSYSSRCSSWCCSARRASAKWGCSGTGRRSSRRAPPGPRWAISCRAGAASRSACRSAPRSRYRRSR